MTAVSISRICLKFPKIDSDFRFAVAILFIGTITGILMLALGISLVSDDHHILGYLAKGTFYSFAGSFFGVLWASFFYCSLFGFKDFFRR